MCIRDSLAIVEARVANQNLRRHMLATEAIMRALAGRLDADPELWGLASLAHDLDCEDTAFAIEVMGEAGEAPEFGVGVEAPGQRAHDGFGGQHMAAQVLVGDACLHDRE